MAAAFSSGEQLSVRFGILVLGVTGGWPEDFAVKDGNKEMTDVLARFTRSVSRVEHTDEQAGMYR